MTQDQFHSYHEAAFDAFCCAVIRNEAIDAHRELDARAQREAQLSALTEEQIASISYEDHYCLEKRQFYVKEKTVLIENPELADALQALQPYLRDILLLFYCLDYTEAEIGLLLQIRQSTVHSRKQIAINRMKQYLEGKER